MADGTIKIDIELDDTGVAKQAQTEGKKAGDKFKEGFEGSSKDVGEKAESSIGKIGKSAGTEGKTAGKKFSDGFDGASKNVGDKASKSIKSAGDGAASIGKAGGSSFASGFLGGIAGLAAGITAVITAGVSAGIAAAEERAGKMASLEIGAMDSGTAMDDAYATYERLVSMLGEVDRSVETTNNLLGLADGDMELLEKSTEAVIGAFARWPDSISIEGLAESMNESARTATIVGSTADAFNWAARSAEEWSASLADNEDAQAAFNAAIEEGATVEDAFNEALAAAGDETDRAKILTDALSDAYGDLATAYEENNKAMGDFNLAKDRVNDALSSLGEAVAPIASDFLNGLAPAIQSAADALSDFTSGSDLSGFLSTFQPVIDEVSQMGETISGTFEDIVNTISETFGPLGDDMAGAGESVFSGINSGLETFDSMVQESLIPAIEALQPYIDDFLQAIEDAEPTFTALGDFIGTVAGIISVVFVEALIIAISIVTFFINVINGLVTFIQSAPEKFGEFVNGVVELVNQLPGKIQAVVDDIVNAITTWASDMKTKASEAGQNFLDAASQKFEEVRLFFTSIPDKLSQAIGDLSNLLWSKGEDLVQGFKDGIASAWDGVSGWVSSKFSSIQLPFSTFSTFSAAPAMASYSVGSQDTASTYEAVPVAAFARTSSVADTLANTIGSVGEQVSATFKNGNMQNVIKVETSSPSYAYNLSIDGMSKYGQEQVWGYVFDLFEVMKREGAM